MRNKLISNPYILYSIIWVFVLCVYNLNWSYLYSPLSIQLIFFILLSSVVTFSIGLLTHVKRVFIYTPLKNIPIIKMKRIMVLLYILLFIEFIYVRNIPLLGYLGLFEKIEYTEFGLPFVHVIIIAGFSVLCLYSYHCLISSTTKKIKRILRMYILLSIIPFILIFNRGAVIACIIGIGSIFLMSNAKSILALCKLAISGLAVLFIFGVMGNIRTDINDVENIILDIGGASMEFRHSHIPKELFWGYIYIATPIGNCDYTIKQNPTIEITQDNIRDFILFEMIPEFISKRIASVLDIERTGNPLVTDSFNVSSIYARPYMYLGWWGIMFMFIYMIMFVTLVVLIIPASSPYYVSAVAAVNIVITQSIFENMLTFMGVIPMVIILCILSLKYNRKRGKNGNIICSSVI